MSLSGGLLLPAGRGGGEGSFPVSRPGGGGLHVLVILVIIAVRVRRWCELGGAVAPGVKGSVVWSRVFVLQRESFRAMGSRSVCVAFESLPIEG